MGLHCKLLWYEPHRFEKWWILHSLRLGEGDTITILSSWPMSPSDRVHPLGTITWHHYAAEWMAPSSPSPFLEQLSPIYPEVLQPIRGPPAFIYYLLVICQEANGSKWTLRAPSWSGEIDDAGFNAILGGIVQATRAAKWHNSSASEKEQVTSWQLQET